MEEFVSCEACLEVCGGEFRCPRVLDCGHIFCSTCIHKLVATSKCCPTCKNPITKDYSNNAIKEQIYSYTKVRDVLGNIIEESDSDLQHLDGPLLSEGFCVKHKVANLFRCMTCDKWICKRCVAVSHKSCKTLLIKEAVQEIKKDQNENILRHIEMVPKCEGDASLVLSHYRDSLEAQTEELQSYQKKIDMLKGNTREMKGKIKRVLKLQTTLASLKEKLEAQVSDNADSEAATAEALEAIDKELSEHFDALQEIVDSVKVVKVSSIQSEGNEDKNIATDEKKVNTATVEEKLNTATDDGKINTATDDEKINIAADEVKETKISVAEETNNKEIVTDKKKLMAAIVSGKKAFITSTEDEIVKYGELNIKDGKLMMHCLDKDPLPPSSSLLLSIDQCLNTMTGGSELPKKIFLQIGGSKGVMFGDVIINLNVEANEASKVVLQSCLFAPMGISLKGMDMVPYGSNVIGATSWLRVPLEVESETLQKEVKKKEWKDGDLALEIWDGNDGMEFRFYIWVKGTNLESEWIPTGKVEKGIDVIKYALKCRRKGAKIKIIDCGTVN